MKRTIFDFHAEVCKTFGNPRRLQILDLLKTKELSVTSITEALGATKSNVSQHLAVMRLSGLLRTRKEGTTVYYRIANEKLAYACSLMQEALEQMMDGGREHCRENDLVRKNRYVHL